jgi:hypothetical protein
VSAAAKDAELYLRRCRKLEGVIADLLASLERIANLSESTITGTLSGEPIVQRTTQGAPDIARAAIARNRGES